MLQSLHLVINHINSGFAEIVANFGVLFVLAWTITLIDDSILGFNKMGSLPRSLMTGLIFGFAAWLAMRMPFEFEPGIIADARGVALFFAGYLSGPIAAIVSFSIAVLYRIRLGGEGVILGLHFISTFTAFGIIAYFWRRQLKEKSKWSASLPVSLVVLASVFSTLGVYSLPAHKQFAVFWALWPNVLLANTLGSYLLVRLLRRERSISRIEYREAKAKEERDSRIQRLIKNSPGMVYQYVLFPQTGEHKMNFVSDQAFKIYEIDLEEFQANPSIFTDLVHTEDIVELNGLIEASAINMTFFEWEGRIRTKSGKVKWVKARSVPEQQSDGSIMWDGLLLDITREKELQKDFETQRTLASHRDKLASIGELAAGVGHEINNPLGILLANLELLLQDSRLLPQVEHRIQATQKAAYNIRNIVNGLRSFSRSDEDTKIAFSAERMILDLKSLINEIYKKQGIHLVFDLDSIENVQLTGSPGKVQQALMNLLSNAKDAIEFQDAKIITLTARYKGEKLRIFVTDNGPGISTKFSHKIFETFFTTKEPGKGTGLGLSLSHRFITELNGKLELYSSSPEGSTFLIELPATVSTSSLTTREQDFIDEGTKRSLSSSSLNILLAEDVEDMRAVLEEMLSSENIQITTVSNGAKALEKIWSAKKPFDIVITDIHMPVMSGIELAKRIRSSFPAAECPKIVFMTGGGDQFQEMESQGLADHVLYKPFSRNEALESFSKLSSFPNELSLSSI